MLPSPPVDDPFASLQPIGQPKPLPPKGFERLSNEENQRRRRVANANRAAGTGRDPMRIFAKRAPRRPRVAGRHLDADEILDMTSTLARKFYAEALENERGTETRRRATAAFGILVDKWTIVSGRPTEIHAFVQADHRAGVLELAARLASSAKASA